MEVMDPMNDRLHEPDSFRGTELLLFVQIVEQGPSYNALENEINTVLFLEKTIHLHNVGMVQMMMNKYLVPHLFQHVQSLYFLFLYLF